MNASTPETLEQLRAENRQLRAQIATLEARGAPAPPITGFVPYGQPIWFDAVSDAIFVTDAERQIQQWNRAAEQIYGWPRAEVLGRLLTAIIPPTRYLDDDATTAMQRLRQEGVWRGMVLQRAHDGRELVIESVTHALTDDQGAPCGYIGVNRDVTARVETQRALERAAERLQVLADASHAFAEVGTAYQAVLDRVAQVAATGLNAECMIYLRSADGAWLDLAAAYDRDPAKVALTRMTVHADPLHVDEPSFATRILHTSQPLFFPVVDPEQLHAMAKPGYRPSLDRLHVRSIIGVPMRAQGRTIGVLVLFRSQPAQVSFGEDDLTLAQDLADRAALAIANARLYGDLQSQAAALQQQADTLRERDAQLRLAYDAAQIGTWRRDLATGLRRVQLDARAQVHYGVTSADLALDDLLARVHPDDRLRVARVMAELTEAGADERVMIEYRLTHPDGTLHWLAVHIGVFATGAGEGRRAVLATGVVQDITARKQVEAELYYQASLLRFVHDAVIATDLSFQITSWNHAAETLYGWSAAEVVGQQTTSLLQTAYPDGDETQALSQLQAAGAWKGEVIQHARDGRAIIMMASVVAMHTPAGEPLGFVAVNRDITDRKQAEAQTRAALAAEQLARRAAEVAAERMTRLQAITAVLAGALTQNAVITVMTDQGPTATGATDVIVTRIDPDDQQLVCVGWSGHSAAELATLPALPLDSPRPMSAAVRDQTPSWLSSRDAAEAHVPGFGAVMDRYGRQAHATLPLISAERALGAISFSYALPQAFAPAERAFLGALAQQCAQALERVQLYGEVLAGHARLQQLSERLIAVQEEERQHLARELHDEIGQSLTGLNLSLTMGPTLSPDHLHAQMIKAQQQVTSLIAQVRQRSLDLRPAMLDDMGLRAALVWFFERYAEQTGITLDTRLQGLERRFPPMVELTAYRIVQEALTNVARHAAVPRAHVAVWATTTSLLITIADTGRGFDVEAALRTHTSSGLAGMRERALLLGGDLTMTAEPGAGTNVLAVLPIGRPGAAPEDVP